MEENFDALEVIAQTKGKVNMSVVPTGEKIFPMWGWLAAFFYLSEFILWQLLHQEWCLWLWLGVPAIGIPLMFQMLKKDYARVHMRTHEAKLVLDYWILAACALFVGGFVFFFAGIYEVVEHPMLGILVGIGAFITGEEMRFRPMIIGGAIGAAIGLCSFLLQGDLWPCQMLAIVLVCISSLIVPGHLFKKSAEHGA